MAISYVSGAAATAASVTMPAHQAGDMIVVYAFRNGNVTAPTIAAGFTALNPAGANLCSFTVGFKIATSSSETSGTWTNATSIVVAVYRNATTEFWTTPVAYTKNGTGTSIDYSISGASFFGARYTLRQSNTEVWHIRAAGHVTATNLTATTPSGWTARSAGGEVRLIDSNGPSSTLPDSVGGNTQTVNSSGGWMSTSVRLESWNGSGIVCMGGDSTSGTSADLMPWHQAGDVIVAFSARANNTPPTLPSGYTTLSSGGANTHSGILAYKVATSSSETNPVFTNGTNTLVTVYRSSSSAFDTIELGAATEGSSTTLSWTGPTVIPVMNQTTKFLRFATFNGTGFMAIPANWTSRTDWGTPNPGIEATDADGTTDADSVGGNTSTFGSSMPWRAITVRLAYKPYSYENVNRNNEPVPTDVVGCYLTLIGGGGATGGAFTARGGGGGGGGGATVRRSFIPKSKLGATYTLTRGAGGASATDGGDTVFASGSVTITAGGGKGGVSGDTTGSAAAGAGGTVTLAGISGVATLSGTAGGAGGDGPTPSVGAAAAANTTGGAPGGGGGGGRNSGGTSRTGGAGGNSNYATGGTGATGSNNPGNPGGNAAAGQPGGGGGGGSSSNSSNGVNAAIGGTGGTYGAGGGGAGGGNYVVAGGAGGAGYALIEWLTVAREENQTVTNAPVPENITGCYVTMTGGGGGGGGGAQRGGTGSGNGGGGGGGGAYIKRVWIPVSALGSTYSVTQGQGGVTASQGSAGGTGGDSVFASGSTTVIAGGGNGGLSASTPTGGAGGTVSIGSFTAESTENGAAGGNGSTAQNVAGIAGGNSTNAGAGGGGGGSNKSTASAGGVGGSSSTVTGGTAGGSGGGGGGDATNAAVGYGGPGGGGGGGNAGFGSTAGGGGVAGLTGGGGGGGGGKEGGSGNAGAGRPGANGYTLVEWVTTNPSQFFSAYGFF